VWLIALFAAGSLVMRAAGCVVNDLWDRDIDRMVARTAGRPLASGALRLRHAFGLLAALLAGGLLILLQLNPLAQLLGWRRCCWWSAIRWPSG
jgi:4-hydroxybenzoate polyprenyltransferase